MLAHDDDLDRYERYTDAKYQGSLNEWDDDEEEDAEADE